MEIYKITNTINGMYYIGQSSYSDGRRLKQHFYSAIFKENDRPNNYFHNAIRAYGKENFTYQVLCKCPDLDSLNKAEEFFVWFTGASKRLIGYNTKEGGLAGRHTEETLTRMAEIQRNRPPVSQKTKERMRAAQLGRKHPLEVREKISKGNKGKRLGVKLSSQHVEAIKKANTGRVKTPEELAKLSASKKGIPKSEEARANMKIAASKRDHTHIKQTSQRQKGKPMPEWHRLNLIEGHRKRKERLLKEKEEKECQSQQQQQN